MPKSLISLGANLGNVRETMLAAKRMLLEKFPIQSRFIFSHLYRTPPVGGPAGQSDFLNAVVQVEHPCNVWEVWDIVKSVEQELGRQRQHRWESRRIDVDVLLHDDECIWTPHFKVPHPRMCMRSFILKPALEIVPQIIDPVSGMTIDELNQHIRNESYVQVVTPEASLTNRLQTAIDHQTTRQTFLWRTIALHEINQLLHPTPENAPRLTIVAVSTPDPETIQWEDYSRGWACKLGMDNPSLPEGILPIGPRYLLPANDIAWAIHEITAAVDAMDCFVEIAHPFE
ncbi:2-amino-4-hydroxy-6-hydroxymethyldihydropteridine diphosphokinase [Pirellulaceae bacterium SH449]